MGYHIKSINLENEHEELKRYEIKHSDPQKNNLLDKLGKINIFVGENNSGKSNFLRQLQSIESYFFYPNNFNIRKGNILRNKFNEFCIRNGFTNHVLKEIEYINSGEELFKLPKETEQQIKSSINRGIQSMYKDYRDSLKNELKIINFDFEKIYIPVLRGLRNPLYENNLAEDIFLNRTKKDYKNLKSEIFTGLSLYEDIKKLLLGTHEEREIIREFENFLSENFFNNEIITLTPKHDSDVIHVSIGKIKDIPIYNLGDGIQSIIILTFPLFKNQGKKLLVFIEEPELFLHAGMQRILVETFLDKRFDGFQYFIATHSNHLLDLTLDLEEEDQISIFTCKKDNNEDKKFIIENVSSSDNSPLKMLGVRNSSIFLSNCTIWVEGLTDRLYLRHYLKLYQEYSNKSDKTKRVFKEDLHFSFVEYSGGNITHWSFLGDGSGEKPTINYEKICNKIFLIADKDYADDKVTQKETEKMIRHKKLKELLGNSFYRLNCIEIENLIKENVLGKVIKEFEKIEDLVISFSQEKYAEERIGRFIDKKILNNSSTRKGKNQEGKTEANKYKYAEKSGTIKHKEKFCTLALKHTKDYEKDLSKEAKELCEKIYDFIKSHNE